MRLDLNADADDALVLMAQLGARTRLLAHHALVLQAADAISLALNALGVPHDAQWLRMGAALHDAGKILHPHEEHEPGTANEAAGQALLLKHGVPAHWASCCVSHGAWQTPGLALEPCAVALADHLWRGTRLADLELRVIDGWPEAVQVTVAVHSLSFLVMQHADFCDFLLWPDCMPGRKHGQWRCFDPGCLEPGPHHRLEDLLFNHLAEPFLAFLTKVPEQAQLMLYDMEGMHHACVEPVKPLKRLDRPEHPVVCWPLPAGSDIV